MSPELHSLIPLLIKEEDLDILSKITLDRFGYYIITVKEKNVRTPFSGYYSGNEIVLPEIDLENEQGYSIYEFGNSHHEELFNEDFPQLFNEGKRHLTTGAIIRTENGFSVLFHQATDSDEAPLKPLKYFAFPVERWNFEKWTSHGRSQGG